MKKATKGVKELLTSWIKIFIGLALLLFPDLLKSQSSLQLRLLPLDRTPEWLAEEVSYEDRHADSLAVASELRLILQHLYGKAYLEASVDTLDCRDSICLALLHIGPLYEWTRLGNGNVPPEFLDQAGFRERLYEDRPFSYEEWRQLRDVLLVFAENHGYPFARVWLDDITVEGDHIGAYIFLDRGPLILLDSIAVRGSADISRNYLSYYLGLRPGSPYDRSQLLGSRDRLRELPFLRAAADPEIAFRGQRAVITMPLEKKNASRFDFLIGVLPNSNQTGKMLITGNFEGELINQFGLGERLYAQFEQLRPQTQELQLAFSYPYVLGLPLGADFDFSLYKRDTTYLDLIFDAGVSYLLQGGNYLKAYWEQRTSSLLSVDEGRLLQTKALPENLDVRNSLFGLEVLYQQLDYRYNPRRGWSAFFRGGAGLKKIRRNSKIEAAELGFLYDSLELRVFQYRLQARLEGFLPIFSRSAFKIGATGGFIFSESDIYRNEQFRIGGNQLLRGFDEEFFFATRYGVGTLEYRLLIGQNSFLYLFGDYAWLLDRTTAQNRTIYPYGFGAGITFETKVGLFGVNLAFGGISGGEPVDFSSPKVHFGYVSRF